MPAGPVTIDYTYDPLNRLTQADYSTGDFYHYSYDAVGNRMSEAQSVRGQALTATYTYDEANRLASVNGVNYTWDANGNLLNDGVNAYTYDDANRLKTFNAPGLASSFAYDGLGDRLGQTINGVPTNYTLDINSYLPNVLADGSSQSRRWPSG